MDEDEFFAGFSNPINREIMRIYKDLDMVEHLGSGVPRILQYYSEEAFQFTSNFTRMVFDFLDVEGGEIGGEIGGEKTLTPRQNEILSLMYDNPRISYRDLALHLGINQSALIKHINNLKSKGVLERRGGTRGHWQVLKKQDKY